MRFDQITLKNRIKSYPDWPVTGITFRDLTPLFNDNRALHLCAHAFVERYLEANITHVAALEARGFILGSIIAYQLNLPIILVRKGGKLPGAVASEDFSLPHGKRRLELQKGSCGDGDRVLIFDDLIATGGSALAASTLIQSQGARVVEAAAVVDLPDMGGVEVLGEAGIPTFTLLAYEGS
ncbi:adenine phosphoribosyltransferase [Saccharospirillum impatiens]|uniref:adenine phosphoribosyltransferase n=1 Tax=Saccharospirillum impatiens TaxID=169438 RepID=UPI00041FED6D|nr:adenine phosphoribosyltransferase [Saccharospirillum impatiens]